MGSPSKRSREIAKLVEPQKVYNLKDAIAILKKCPPVKFDQSLDISLRMALTHVDQTKQYEELLRYRTEQENLFVFSSSVKETASRKLLTPGLITQATKTYTKKSTVVGQTSMLSLQLRI